MQVNTIKGTITVALGVCLVCSFLVAALAVALNPIQTENRRLDKIKNILLAGELDINPATLDKVYSEKIKPQMLDLDTDQLLAEDAQTGLLDPNEYNIQKVMGDDTYGKALTANEDVANIKRVPTKVAIYKVVDDAGKLDKIILPIYGKGLWSTMYGFLALGSDLKTIKGITFYEHGETPGLGGEIDNPQWKASWKGKDAFNEQGDIIITVLKGKVDPSSPNANHQIDGLSGSTITTRGLDSMLDFWLGNDGYGPYIESLRKEAQGV
ncbi:MAG: Na(+)-translocating NADH-quinone reductase subunit C [Calditrichota bacterium]